MGSNTCNLIPNKHHLLLLACVERTLGALLLPRKVPTGGHPGQPCEQRVDQWDMGSCKLYKQSWCQTRGSWESSGSRALACRGQGRKSWTFLCVQNLLFHSSHSAPLSGPGCAPSPPQAELRDPAPLSSRSTTLTRSCLELLVLNSSWGMCKKILQPYTVQRVHSTMEETLVLQGGINTLWMKCWFSIADVLFYGI